MYKNILVILILFCNLQSLRADVYKQNCLSCHQELDISIDKFFYKYLMVFSSEDAVKMSMKDYLMHPMKEKSLIYEGLLQKYGVKEPTKLSEKELSEAIDIFWERYKVFGKLK